MTQPADRFAAHFGEGGVRHFATGPAEAARPAAATPALIDGLTLPLQVSPYFHTSADEPASLSAYVRSIGRPLDEPGHATWARLGSDRAYDLAVTPDGEVWGILIGYDEPNRFVNTTAENFANGLLHLDQALQAISSTDDPDVAKAAFEALDAALRHADEPAFSSTEHWWPLVLEDIRTTAGVQTYATFEFTTAAGLRQTMSEHSTLCAHPEERLWAGLSAAGIQPEDVTRIHTEIQACFTPGHYCALWLELQFPDARLTHNLPYGDTAEQRAASLRRLQEAPGNRRPGNSNP
ncbi:nucleic acid/nucleotide deaminase domain-containing protein [Streptomyces sp. CB03911]|uniref:nucleic acid/nucleotide deaminase domain-containing protein n=1 Tax=Streptomyces sp. CB03911 TaxID=1804758 RepID=UPI00093C39C3|nr:nucleic acid/nucleotide deaminase domain-containing protein [Streptomyces sp. CB03911]OKI13256.1 hypothetical protein A6A07_15220 [Streptomyces sp. CB03911]